MSREVVFLRWCSICESDGVERVEALGSYTIGLVKGEGRPALRVLDVCADHAEELRLYAVMVGKHSIPFDPKAKPTAAVSPPVEAVEAVIGRTKTVKCRVCDEEKSRASIVQHIWAVHHKGGRPAQPEACPECGKRFAPSGMGVHRSTAHAYDPLAEAYEGAAT